MPRSIIDTVPVLLDRSELAEQPANLPTDLILPKCVLWTGAKAYGYGLVHAGGRLVNTHRVSYIAFKGEIPEGHEIDHLCRVRACWNPEHLEAVTPAENRRRQAAVITHCPAGHEYTDANTRVWIDRKGHRHRNCRRCAAIAASRRRRR